MPDKISVLLVDDHALVRRGFRRILEDEPDISVTGEAGDGLEAIKLADETKDSLVKDSKDYKWVLRSASLELVPDSGGKWFWLVNYEAEFQGGFSGVPYGLRLAVLMDGKVVKPEVKEYP